jgi:hypothetical protein
LLCPNIASIFLQLDPSSLEPPDFQLMRTGSTLHQLGGEPNAAKPEKHPGGPPYIQGTIETQVEWNVFE